MTASKTERRRKPVRACGALPFVHAPDRIRTCDLRLRRPTLYPTELRARRTNVRRRDGCGSSVEWARRPGGASRHGRRREHANKPSSVPAEAGEDHFSGTDVTAGLERPTRDSMGRATPRPLFGLAPGGVCRATSVAGRPVRSYRTVSPLPVPPRGGHRRSALCCTFHRLAAPGSYPAPCPAELGLSSGDASGRSPRPPAILTHVLETQVPRCRKVGPGEPHSSSADPAPREWGGALMMATRARAFQHRTSVPLLP